MPPATTGNASDPSIVVESQVGISPSKGFLRNFACEVGTNGTNNSPQLRLVGVLPSVLGCEVNLAGGFFIHNTGLTNSRCYHRGFSLLEMMVAIAILGVSLAVLYQIVAGATRIVGSDEKYAYGVELARSLLADNGAVPLDGIRSDGETAGGYSWSVITEPVQFPEGGSLIPGTLHFIVTRVSWVDAGKTREVSLHSVVPGIEIQ